MNQDENQKNDKKDFSNGTQASSAPTKNPKNDNPYPCLDSEIIISDCVSLFGTKQEL